MFYTNVPQDFSYEGVYANLINHTTRTSKEYYLKMGKALSLPYFLRYLNVYLSLNDRVIFLPNVNRITRTTDPRYWFNHYITAMTRAQSDESYNHSFYFTQSQIDTFNLKDIFSIQLVSVTGQIQDVFEQYIPAWAQSSGATELLGVSLALKITPKHRIRVYTINNHIVVFTTKGLEDAADNDYKLYRKLWACLPLIRGWVTSEQETECPDIVELCRALDNDDAAAYWTLLEHYYSINETVKNLKYNGIIQAFNSMAVNRQMFFQNQISQYESDLINMLDRYAKTLENKRTVERQLLDIQQSDTTIETDVIKRLVDKKVCYDLDISNINGADGSISYRCSTPLLSYDKDAAKVVYNKRVKEYYSDTLAKLFKILFVDEKAMLVFTQAIDIQLTRGTINARARNTWLSTDLNKCFPNPHHYNHNCWGSYGPIITRLIHEYKLEEVFYQIKAAMGSLNFTDYPVISGFLDMLKRLDDGCYNPACIYWRDENCTTLHTVAETLEHFREEITE